MDLEQDLGSTIGNQLPRWNHIARQIAHRPWFPPAGPWIVAQSWRDLLFAHWPIAPSAIRPHLPVGLELDTYAGDAWIGVVPFRISYIAPRGVPRRLHLGFPELNVRTYVTIGGKPGVWFFSLDAASALAVISARIAFHLPYYWARIDLQVQEHDDTGWITYTSHRHHLRAPTAEFVARYRPSGPRFRSALGSLEAWLTERYCLYAVDHGGRLYRTEIHHAPWPLQPAEAGIAINTMVSPDIGFVGKPLLHFARDLDVIAWAPRRLQH